MSLKRPDNLELNKPEAIALLLEPKKARWLEPFMPAPCTLKEAAECLDTSMSAYSYWLKQFVEQGLLELALESSRRGSPIKHYWTTAEHFSFCLDKASLEIGFNTAILEALGHALASDSSRGSLKFTVTYTQKHTLNNFPQEVKLSQNLMLQLPDFQSGV
jgi:hypothetical protein